MVGFKEKPNLFLSLEYKAGREDKLVAVRYCPWITVIGPVESQKDDLNCSANFTCTIESPIVHDSFLSWNLKMCASLMIKGGRLNERSDVDAIRRGPLEESTDKFNIQNSSMLLDSKSEWEIRNEELN